MFRLAAVAAAAADARTGLAARYFDNTALSGPAAAAETLQSVHRIPLCLGATCAAPSGLLLTGRVRPPSPGQYGFNLTFDPPLPFPSPDAWARLWVADHQLYPPSEDGRVGGTVPQWIPLPLRALAPLPVEHPGAAPMGAYEVRVEYVCRSGSGCGGGRTVSLVWAAFAGDARPRYAPVPASALVPTQSGGEVKRRALGARLQRGWGTWWYPSMLAWTLLPEGLTLKAGLFRRSTGAYLSPERLTANPGLFHSYVIRPGLHAYNQSYAEASLTWRGGGGNVNVSIAATVAGPGGAELTLTVGVNRACGGCAAVDPADYVFVLQPNFTHGRAGTVAVGRHGVGGAGAGLRARTLALLAPHTAVDWSGLNTSAVPPGSRLGVSLSGADVAPVVLSTDPTAATSAAVAARTAAHRAAEAKTLEPYGAEWGEVKDAMQTSLAWSFVFDPLEGLVAPVTRNWGFGPNDVDGDESMGLFCWDGSFASYMLGLDALDLSVSNLIQIVKGRTSAGFIPSIHAGTFKSRDRTNPPVTAQILQRLVDRWGPERMRWVVELCFDDLLNWNTWMYARRREAPAGLLSWGSDPYPYAPDCAKPGQCTSDRGTGGGGANLESGLDNSPVTEGVPFNETGLYVQDEYDAGYTGMFLMDCRAQMKLAALLGRTEAAATLQRRFDTVNAAMLKLLWNGTAGYFQNKLSSNNAPIERMAPTHFYPLLAGPEKGPSEAQAREMIVRHLTNPRRFAVWESGSPPVDRPPPPEEARPLVQWRAKPPHSATHTLCCQLACNFDNRGSEKVRYEGMGLASVPPSGRHGLVPLYVFRCGSSPNSTDLTFGPAEWRPSAAEGGPCRRVAVTNGDFAVPAEAMWVHRGPGANLVPLVMYYTPGDHLATATAEGAAEAAAAGYRKLGTLGYVWPTGYTSRYGLPSISRDDRDYIDQNYWHGRLWAPMIQLVYWALEPYKGREAIGARKGLVAQSKALLLREWRGYGNASAPGGSFAGSGRYVYENMDADTGEGYGYSSEAQPLYSWGALAGAIGLQEHGFYKAR